MKSLRRITYDGYIFLAMSEYQKKNGSNYGFIYAKVANRNPKQVCDDLWLRILYQHLHQFNYN
jgi:hypothetical protein